jgi:cystathionine beta-lyase
VSVALLAALKAGDHLLMTDSCYGPTRYLSTHVLAQLGVETTFYDPRAGASVEALIRPNTRVVFLESPGSLTFEIQDVPAIARVCRARGVTTIIDNTWATPLFFRPIEHGVDLVVHALTKYQSGNSDILLGAVSCADDAWWKRVKTTAEAHGHYAHPDDCATCLRGMRSLEVRVKRHEESALEVARWLESRAEVVRVLHPALPSHPDHALWKRDFTGSTGLFGCVLRAHPSGRAYRKAFLESLRLFGMGFSWGGFESLVVASDVRTSRIAPPFPDAASNEGTLLRLSIGLEDPRDLIADVSEALAAAAAVI